MAELIGFLFGGSILIYFLALILKKGETETNTSSEKIENTNYKQIGECPKCNKTCCFDEYKCEHCGEKFWNSRQAFEERKQK